jgi:hypothetical protein
VRKYCALDDAGSSLMMALGNSARAMNQLPAVF